MELKKNSCMEVILREVEYKAWDKFDDLSPFGDDFDIMKLATFMTDEGNYLVFENTITGKLYRSEFEVEDGDVKFKEKEEIEEGYLLKYADDNATLKQFANKEVDFVTQLVTYKNVVGEYPKVVAKKKEKEIKGTILKEMSDEEKQIVHGAVLIPDEPDTDGDVVSKEKIEEVAYEWMLKYRNVDLQHTLNNTAYPVESYLLRSDKTVTSLDGQEMTLPAGTWMVSVKVADDEVWEAIKDGELNGFSIMGIPKKNMESVRKNKDEVALKRTTLADIEARGDDWVVPFFSIVDEPAVPKGRLISLKSKEEEDEPKENIFKKLKDIFTSEKEVEKERPYIKINDNKFPIKAGREFSQNNKQKLEAMMVALSDMLSDFDITLVEQRDGEEVEMTPEDLVLQYEEEYSEKENAGEEVEKSMFEKTSMALLDEGGVEMDREEIKAIMKEVMEEIQEEEVNKEEEVVEEETVEKEEEQAEETVKKEEEKEEEVEKSEEEDVEEEEVVEKEEEDNEDLEETLKELKDELETLKEENKSLKEFKGSVEKKFKTTKSNQPDGQDTDEEKVEKSTNDRLGRDSLGRKIQK